MTKLNVFKRAQAFLEAYEYTDIHNEKRITQKQRKEFIQKEMDLFLEDIEYLKKYMTKQQKTDLYNISEEIFNSI